MDKSIGISTCIIGGKKKMLHIGKKTIWYIFLIMPFIEPGIFGAFQSMAPICDLYNIWLIVSTMLIFMKVQKNN